MVSVEATQADANSGRSAGISKFYIAAWRWHFYAGLYVAPFMIMLAVTGLIMMYIAFFDGRDGENITVPVSGAAQAISAQAQAAQSAFPEASLVEWIGAKTEGGVSVFRVNDDGTNHMVAVDPYTAEVVDSWIRRGRLVRFRIRHSRHIADR